MADQLIAGETSFSYGGAHFTYTDGKSYVQKYTTKYDSNGNKIYCVWYNTQDRTLAHKGTTLYMEYPQQRNAGVVDGQFIGFNNASIQGSSRPNDITLSECFNCKVDISKTNNSTKTVDGLGDYDSVYVFDGANNTVNAGNYDTVTFSDKRNGNQEYYGGLKGLTKGTYNQEHGKIK